VTENWRFSGCLLPQFLILGDARKAVKRAPSPELLRDHSFARASWKKVEK